MTIIKLPKMEEREIEKLIGEQFLCRIAFMGENHPYIAPFHYIFMNRTLYFHFTDYGRKMKLFKKDKQVCVEIEKYKPDLSEYMFVVLRGTLNVVTDPLEREQVIRRMADQGKRMLSENFLPAHGLRKEEGWSLFTPEKPLIILKLEKLVEQMGLRSP